MRGKTDGAHHAERVVGKGDVGVEGGADDALLHILYAAERVQQFAVPLFVETDSQRIDSEIAAVLVFLQGAVLYNGIAGIVAVTLAAGTYKLQFEVVFFDLCGTIGTEYA